MSRRRSFAKVALVLSACCDLLSNIATRYYQVPDVPEAINYLYPITTKVGCRYRFLPVLQTFLAF